MDVEVDEGGGDEGSPAWMATFADLCTLLLTFFVLLLSFAEMDVTEFKQMLGSVRDAFGVQFETVGSFEAQSSSPVSLDGRAPAEEGEGEESDVEEDIAELIEAMGLESEVEVHADAGGITVRIRERVLFGSGSADLDRGSAGTVLASVVELGSRVASEIAIHGHTDDRPIGNMRYPSNWELSAARASSVVRFLVATGQTADLPISIAGYADTRPIVPNDSDEHRAQNRRVEFRFVRRASRPATEEASEEASDDTPPGLDTGAPDEATPDETTDAPADTRGTGSIEASEGSSAPAEGD